MHYLMVIAAFALVAAAPFMDQPQRGGGAELSDDAAPGAVQPTEGEPDGDVD